MRRRVAPLALALLLALGGCGGAHRDGESAPDSLVDGLGRPLTAENPQRVVALMGGFAEVWLLAGGELVGVSADAIEERQLPLGEEVGVVGAFNNPSTEAVLALEPDLVLLSAETAAHRELLPVLEGADIPCAAFSVNHFADYLEMLRICTAITGRADLYESNGLEVQARLDELRGRYAGAQAGSALLLITYSGGLAVQGSDSMAGQMLAEMGCDNLADRSPSLLREISVEHILLEDPDWLFVIAMGNSEELARRNLEESIVDHPAWGSLRAVREGRSVLLPKEQFLYKPNARWAESYEYLAEVLYGE